MEMKSVSGCLNFIDDVILCNRKTCWYWNFRRFA